MLLCKLTCCVVSLHAVVTAGLTLTSDNVSDQNQDDKQDETSGNQHWDHVWGRIGHAVLFWSELAIAEVGLVGDGGERQGGAVVEGQSGWGATHIAPPHTGLQWQVAGRRPSCVCQCKVGRISLLGQIRQSRGVDPAVNFLQIVVGVVLLEGHGHMSGWELQTERDALIGRLAALGVTHRCIVRHLNVKVLSLVSLIVEGKLDCNGGPEDGTSVVVLVDGPVADGWLGWCGGGGRCQSGGRRCHSGGGRCRGGGRRGRGVGFGGG